MTPRNPHPPDPEAEDRRRLASELEQSGIPPMVAPARLARFLDMDRRRIYELIHSGELNAVRVAARTVRVSRSSIVAWIAAGGFGSRGKQRRGPEE